MSVISAVQSQDHEDSKVKVGRVCWKGSEKWRSSGRWEWRLARWIGKL